MYISKTMHRVANLFVGLLIALTASSASAEPRSCTGTVYLTLDTGSMSHADYIADVLKKHGVKVTFFLANEPTVKGFKSLDDYWTPYWRARAEEGHAFGSHTYDHGYFRRDIKGEMVSYDVSGKPLRMLNAGTFCDELNRSQRAFKAMTGRGLDPFWRAPGGRTTPNAIRFGKECGYSHVGWTPAGFLGDELPSDRYPNQVLLKQAIEKIRDGDILMMHLGIWSRRNPFAPMLDPLITALKARGLCFGLIPDRPKYID